uniref:E3 ubiquitin-protein ligase At4g11680 n=1 Tax=Anthurium amnicola TaxID=1678845 RepID=A0A1D1Y207_9ARAE
MEARQYSSSPASPTPLPLLVRAAVRVSRARWYGSLRRAFHYQNGLRSDAAGNPFNSGPWLAWEFASLLVQIAGVTVAMAASHRENPVWPLRVWVAGYNLGNLLSLPLLYWRYRHARASAHFSDPEQQLPRWEETRGWHLMNRCRTLLELFFAVWFVMGNVWVFDSRLQGPVGRSPVLHTLCVALLAWNAVGYSFPFLLFLLLCCCVPLASSALGYNMNLGADARGASDDEIASLPHWRFTRAQPAHVDLADKDWECCICLAKYNDKEEVRRLPCAHLFHLRCVDQWLKIIACCPLCKQELER